MRLPKLSDRPLLKVTIYVRAIDPAAVLEDFTDHADHILDPEAEHLGVAVTVEEVDAFE